MRGTLVTSLLLLLLLMAVSGSPRRRREACWLGVGACSFYCRVFGGDDAKEGQCVQGTCRCVGGGLWGNGNGNGGFFPNYGNGNGGFYPNYGNGGFPYPQG